MSTSQRLELALERMQSSDWQRFEKIASIFLSSEFDELRTVASQSGDGGRDAELYSSTGEPSVVIQYSVAVDWRGKINATVKRLRETMPNVHTLLYLTNQVVGANCDELRKALRSKYGLSLDIRDRRWFIERVSKTMANQQAAEELACIIVDPYLNFAGVGPYVQAELSSPEAIAAVTFLGLQWRDDVRDKGLTKIAFESLVRAALVNTDSKNRLSRDLVKEKVRQLIPDHSSNQIALYVDGALKRLSKQKIKHWPREDEFCLSHEEVQRLKEYRAEAALSERNLLATIRFIANKQISHYDISDSEHELFAQVLRVGVDAILFDRSQAFAMAVKTETLPALADVDFGDILTSVVNKALLPIKVGVDWNVLLKNAIREVLISNDSAIHIYLRSMSDAYTLLAFLKQTPDVQGAVEKMFSYGMLWLDTTIILPLIADELEESEETRGRFTRMIDAAREAGLKLYVTPGVIEEVERHMNRALTCSRLSNGKWEGSVPFLLERFISTGRASSTFDKWLELFRGEVRPLQDISEYLADIYDIKEHSLSIECESSSPELKYALQNILYDRYERRKEKYGSTFDEMAITKLVTHDVECYCGVLQYRKKSHTQASPFGYTAWWLTVDRHVFDLKSKLRHEISDQYQDSPVISADFLVNYLAFGPVRRNITKSKESNLPLLMVLGSATALTSELISEADKIRQDMKEMPERLIRRKVRDHLDMARARIGPIANMGMDVAEDCILSMYD